MLSEKDIRLYERAGAIAAKALSYALDIVHEGMPIIELCEKTESMIRKLGGHPAFPCNISVNFIAAHYTSPPNDSSVIPSKSVVKIDVGVHINGYIADTAATISFDSSYEVLIEAVRRALNAAITSIKNGTSLGKIGALIEKTIKSHGFMPIDNLTGHMIKPWILHAGKSIPNVATMTLDRVRYGEVYAIEPFATNGAGHVVEERNTYIFSYGGRKVRSKKERLLIDIIWKRFRFLPFCERWIMDLPEDLKNSLSSLQRRGSIYGYPVLREVKGGIVSQWEHTVIVLKHGVLVTTLME